MTNEPDQLLHRCPYPWRMLLVVAFVSIGCIAFGFAKSEYDSASVRRKNQIEQSHFTALNWSSHFRDALKYGPVIALVVSLFCVKIDMFDDHMRLSRWWLPWSRRIAYNTIVGFSERRFRGLTDLHIHLRNGSIVKVTQVLVPKFDRFRAVLSQKRRTRANSGAVSIVA